ncbi:PA containing protein [Pseudonocardia nantongensis]|uniref:PA containing protein n=1 Tax=Pseudonocardia nantongensis TaxID=1181885 RepID=UPI00397DF49A
MSDTSNLSFDRMRGMLNRAAEIRDSEQQQIFDSLDEIHARLAALDAIGTVRKKLTDLPDRTELNVLAERVDETVTKLDNQEVMLGAITRAIESLPDRLAKPIAQLDGRLDAMAGRMEGVSGRMDGLDDRLGGLHKRLDDLDNRLDRHEMRLDAMPNAVASPIKERVEGVERNVKEQLDAATQSFEETGEGLRNLLGDTSVGLHRRLEELAQRPAVDPAPGFDALTERIEALAARLEEVGTRMDTVETGLEGRFGDLDGAVKERLGKLGGSLKDRLGELDGTVTSRLGELDGKVGELDGSVQDRLTQLTGDVDNRLETLSGTVEGRLTELDTALRDRPDTSAVTDLVGKANADSERRNASQLDEAMATFAELIMGRGGQYAQQTPPPPPRPAQRRTRQKVAVKSQNGASAADLVAEDPDE